jgi:hypothetical protein
LTLPCIIGTLRPFLFPDTTTHQQRQPHNAMLTATRTKPATKPAPARTRTAAAPARVAAYRAARAVSRAPRATVRAEHPAAAAAPAVAPAASAPKRDMFEGFHFLDFGENLTIEEINRRLYGE